MTIDQWFALGFLVAFVLLCLGIAEIAIDAIEKKAKERLLEQKVMQAEVSILIIVIE